MNIYSLFNLWKKIVTAVIAQLIGASAYAQIVITGCILDTKKNELPAATVRCYINDTVYVNGTTSNNKGEFELKVPQSEQAYKLLFTYLGYKEQTLLLNPTKEREVRLGEIVMNNDNIQMQEVTVVGENMVQTEEKMIVYPTKEQLRYTYDGYSAIDALLIPGLRLDPISQTPTYLNQNILLCIDGREASQAEVQDLNAKDIARVDLYTNGKPDFPEADYVLDFVMKKRDYAGSVVANATQQLNAARGDARVTTQYFQNQSEWAVSARSNYDRMTYRFKGNTNTTYQFPTETITQIDEYGPSTRPATNFNTYANYIFKNKEHDFYASLRFNRDDRSLESEKLTGYSNRPETLNRQEWSNVQNINPALQLRYKRALKNNQQLRIELYGSYGNNYYDNSYEYRTESDEITSAYARSTDENSWYVRPRINYTKTFRNKSSLNVELDQRYTHTHDKNLRQGSPYEVTMDNSVTKLYATFNYRIQKRLSLQVRLAGNFSYTRTDGDSEFEPDFIPSLRLNYLYKKHSLRVNFSVDNTEPSLANRTGNEYQEDDYMYFVGNTHLKNYLTYNPQVVYSWMATNRFTLNANLWLQYKSNPIYRGYSYDPSRESFVSLDMNGKRYFKPNIYVELQYALVPQMLTVGLAGMYERTDATLWDEVRFNRYLFYGYLDFRYKGFRLNASMTCRNKDIDSFEGTIAWRPAFFVVNASYNIDNWSFNMRMGSPFIRIQNEDYLNQGGYSETRIIGCKRVNDNTFRLTVNYRFNFGKKKHKFDNSEVEDVNKSTIMK